MNFIITCARHFEEEAKEEITEILDGFGCSEIEVNISDMPGILTVRSHIEPIQLIHKIRDMISEEPWSVRYCLRFIPIQKTVETEQTQIKNEVQTLLSQISKNETYKILIEKRNSTISSQELITFIASDIKNKVSLENPDKIILIEILGNKTGISIIKESDILSVEKLKRRISE